MSGQLRRGLVAGNPLTRGGNRVQHHAEQPFAEGCLEPRDRVQINVAPVADDRHDRRVDEAGKLGTGGRKRAAGGQSFDHEVGAGGGGLPERLADAVGVAP